MSGIAIYNKMMKKKRLLQLALSKSKSKAKPAAPKLKQSDIVAWIQANGKQLIDLLPRDAQVGTLQYDKFSGDQVHFKKLQLQAWVRLARKADKLFVAWLQQRYAAHQSGTHQMTKGEQKLLVHHYIKMDAVWDSGDPIDYLRRRSPIVSSMLAWDRVLHLIDASCTARPSWMFRSTRYAFRERSRVSRRRCG